MNSEMAARTHELETPDLYWSVAEYSPLPMAAVEGAGHIVRYVNPALCLLIGSSKEQLVGNAFSAVGTEWDEFLSLLDQVFRTGQAETHTGEEPSEPNPFYWSYSMWPVLSKEGYPAAIMIQVLESTVFHQQTIALNQALMMGSVRQHELTEDAERLNAQLDAEIRERKQVEAALLSQGEELARSNSDLLQFAHITSHDLQEPLRAMLGFSQLLAQRYEGKLDEDANVFLGYIVTGARRMKELIDSLLAYSRVGSKKAAPFVLAPMEDAVHWATMNLKLALEETGGTVTHGVLPMLKADQRQLVQLFQNLISNAIKYRNPNEPPHIHITAEAHEETWLISVQDNGIGIKPEHTEQIFGVFKRLHGKEIPGTGIGLAIAKRIVENHGGKIWVGSEPGEGSTFYFTLLR